MSSRIPVPSLHLVTSRRRLSPDARTVRDEIRALEALLEEAIGAGVDVVQIRERDLEAGVLAALVRRVVSRAAGAATRVLVNERADVAAAVGAAGVHLPSTGVRAARLRSIGPDWTIGRSIHAGDATLDADALDYLLFGTVFPSESKPTGEPVAGLEGLRAAVGASERPVVAIGGITPALASECLAAGAAGIAAIGAFLPPGRARDAIGARAAVEAFREGWEAAGWK